MSINQVVVCACNPSTEEMEAEVSQGLGHYHFYMEFSVNQATSDPVFKGGQGLNCRCYSPGQFKKDLHPDCERPRDKAGWPGQQEVFQTGRNRGLFTC